MHEAKLNIMKSLLTMTIVILLASCAGSKMYSSYTDWDSNSNKNVDRYEFVNGYAQSDYFDKWSKGKESISYEEFYEGVFKDLDADKDNKLSLVEFNSKIDFFYFGLFNGGFNKWDSDSNASLDANEFYNEVRKTNLASIWDTSDDKRISRRELAGGMFYLSDADNNGQVDSLEFNVWKVNR